MNNLDKLAKAEQVTDSILERILKSRWSFLILVAALLLAGYVGWFIHA